MAFHSLKWEDAVVRRLIYQTATGILQTRLQFQFCSSVRHERPVAAGDFGGCSKAAL